MSYRRRRGTPGRADPGPSRVPPHLTSHLWGGDQELLSGIRSSGVATRKTLATAQWLEWLFAHVSRRSATGKS